MNARESRDNKTQPARSFDDYFAEIAKKQQPITERDELLLEIYEQLHEKHSNQSSATTI
ncbi:MAG: hypothetical protein WAM94_06500 [Chromatiaceae bacterium]